jgi:hypothetical protein
MADTIFQRLGFASKRSFTQLQATTIIIIILIIILIISTSGVNSRQNHHHYDTIFQRLGLASKRSFTQLQDHDHHRTSGVNTIIIVGVAQVDVRRYGQTGCLDAAPKVALLVKDSRIISVPTSNNPDPSPRAAPLLPAHDEGALGPHLAKTMPPIWPMPSLITQFSAAARGTAPAPSPMAYSSACVDSTPFADDARDAAIWSRT